MARPKTLHPDVFVRQGSNGAFPPFLCAHAMTDKHSVAIRVAQNHDHRDASPNERYATSVASVDSVDFKQRGPFRGRGAARETDNNVEVVEIHAPPQIFVGTGP